MIEILSKPAERIGADDIQSLTASKVPEGEQIEYKEALAAKGDGAPDPWMSGEGRIGDRARNAVLEEVTAFAKGIAPIPQCTELAERLKLVFRDCVEPPFPVIEIVGVPTRDHDGVVVIRVGKSRRAPHRVTTTLACPIRRQDRCEKMTMREIQDMTLNVSRGLERLDRRLSERAEQFPKEFDKLKDPQNAFGIRMTALPVIDGDIRFDRVYRRGEIVEQIDPLRHRVIETKPDSDDNYLKSLDEDFNPNYWRPMIRAARAYLDSRHNNDRMMNSYREVHCDGLIEWGVLSCKRSPMRQDACPLFCDWPIVLFANLIAWVHRVRDAAGVPTIEYAAEIEICVRGIVLIPNEGNCRRPWLDSYPEGSTVFPRFPLGGIDEISTPLKRFRRDFLNKIGEDIDDDEDTLAIE